MREPPRRSKAATIEAHSTVSREGKKIDERHVSRTSLLDIPDGTAQVQVTHGIKRWESSKESGMTVETTCTVTIPCLRDEMVLADANNYASNLAHNYAWQNHKAIQKDLDRFVEWLESK